MANSGNVFLKKASKFAIGKLNLAPRHIVIRMGQWEAAKNYMVPHWAREC